MSAHEDQDLMEECRALVRQIFTTLRKSASPDWLALDLTMGQLKAMLALSAHGPQRVGELGRRLGLSEPAASLLTDKLEERGYARRERDAQDRRRCLVALTAAGRDLTTRLHESREEQIFRWVAALDEGELRGLVAGFRGLLRAAEDQQAHG